MSRGRRSATSVLGRAVAAWSARAYDGKLDALLDLSGNGLHARLGSAVGADTNDPLRLQYRGQREIYFPGSAGNYINFTALTAFGTGDFAVSIRCIYSVLGGKIIGAAADGFTLSVNGAGLLVANKQGVADVAASSSGVVAGQDSVLGYSRSGTEGKYYVDGVLVGTVTDTNNYTVGVSGIGGTLAGTANMVTGYARWARVYSAALDATAMAADAAGTRQANCVLDFQATNLTEPYASIADGLGNTLTLNRSATGRKLAVVDRDLLQLGTDDYLEVADSPLLNFGAGQPLTVFAAFRQYATPKNFGQYIAKASALSVGYHLESHATNLRTYSFASDGTNTSQGYAGAGLYVSGTSIAAATIRSASGITSAWRSGITASILGNITGDLSNTAPLRIGRGGTGSYQDFEFFGAAVFREALTADDLRRLTAEMGVS